MTLLTSDKGARITSSVGKFNKGSEGCGQPQRVKADPLLRLTPYELTEKDPGWKLALTVNLTKSETI